MATEVGSAYVSILPSAKGFASGIAAQIVGPTQAAGLAAGRAGGASLSSGLYGAVRGVSGQLAGWLGFAGLGIAAFKAAENVEAAFNTIARATGASGAQLEGLEESFKRVASVSPASFGAIATAMGDLATRTGLTGEELELLTRQVVTFNRISAQTPIDVQSMTQAMAAFNIPAEDMSETLDHMWNISQKTGVSVDEMTQTLLTAGPIARQFGWSLEFTAGFLAQLNKQGVDANALMPGLKRAFRDFAEAGRDPAVALQETIGAMQDLIRAGDIAEARQLAVQLFGARGSGLVDAAIAGKFSLEALNATIDVTGDGILGTASKTGTLAGKLGTLKNQASLALAAFGTPVLKIATDLFARLVPIVGVLGTTLSKLSPIVVPLLAAFLAMKAATLLLTVVTAAYNAVLSIGTANLTTFAMTTETAAVAATTAGITMQAAAPLVAAFTAAFLLTTTVLGHFFKKSDETKKRLDFLEQSIAAVGNQTGTALVQAFQRAVSAQEGVARGSDLMAGHLTKAQQAALAAGSQFKVFRDITENNIGAAKRLAEEYRNQPAIYQRMQQIIAETIGLRQQEAADTAASSDAINATANAISNLASTVSGSLPTATGLITEAANALSGMGKALDPATVQQKFAETLFTSGAFFANLKTIFEAGFADLAGVIAQSGPVAGGQLAASVADGIRNGQPGVAEELNNQTKAIQTQSQELVDWTTNTLGPALHGANAGAVAQAAAGTTAAAPQVGSAALAGGQAASTQWTAGLGGIAPGTTAAVQGAGPIVTAQAQYVANLFAFSGGQQIGLAFVDGIASGIAHGEFRGTAQDAMRSLINATIAAGKAAAGIASPSKVFAELGGYMTAGLAEGLETGIPDVVKAVQRVVSAANLAGQRGLPAPFVTRMPTVLSELGTPTVSVPDVAVSSAATATGGDTFNIYTVASEPLPFALEVSRRKRREMFLAGR